MASDDEDKTSTQQEAQQDSSAEGEPIDDEEYTVHPLFCLSAVTQEYFEELAKFAKEEEVVWRQVTTSDGAKILDEQYMMVMTQQPNAMYNPTDEPNVYKIASMEQARRNRIKGIRTWEDLEEKMEGR